MKKVNNMKQRGEQRKQHLEPGSPVTSLILAAGRGSRMKDYDGNKALLPLIPQNGPYRGTHTILENIVQNLPQGHRIAVVHHRKEDVISCAAKFGLLFVEQPVLDGTGGALLAASSLLERLDWERLIITMGDVPFVRRQTYLQLIEALDEWPMVVLGFKTNERRQYGLLETQGPRVRKIVEWKYWKDYDQEQMKHLSVCNSGIYSIKRDALFCYLPLLRTSAHQVTKQVNGVWKTFPEYFITDLVELMARDGIPPGYILAQDEIEVMGVDDLEALKKAQYIFAKRKAGNPAPFKNGC